MSQPSSTARTVFVRFVPPSANVRRHHLEDLFSQIGPIKKSSVIVPHAKGGSGEPEGQETTTASSYGFVKYVAEEDAQKAAQKLDRSMLRISADEKIQLRVERASDVAHKKTKHHDKSQAQGNDDHHAGEDAMSHKKTNRLILRNLSFYAKESHIRKALESFGPIEEIHLPTVSDKNNNAKTKTFHRGFGFVTFVNAKDAQKCLKAKEIEIYKRKVQIAKALHKSGYEKLKHDDDDAKASPKNSKHTKKEPSLRDERPIADDKDDDDDSASSDGSNSASSEDEQERKDKGSDNDEDSQSSSESEKDDASEVDGMDEKSMSEEGSDDNDDDENNKDSDAVREKRSLFLRNLPFDATRHDIFEAFRKYGRISSIYIVKDKQSGLPRGTAFLSFETLGAAHRAMQAAGSDNFASQRDVSEGKDGTHAKMENSVSEGDGIILRGRRIFVNIAVDRDTATTLTLDKQADRGKVTGKDRRNLYLKGEGRVDNDGDNNLWDQLPEQDKLKRQKAWSDKNTKLKSPLFLISPTRLSIRNIAKDVDERSLKKLCVSALQRGLQKKLVTAEDQIAQWRAAGEMTTREIIQKVDGLEHKDDIIPEFDEKNVRKYIPSVVVERDFSSNNKNGAPSRGFGFVEFLHHTHALACLRELNNNTFYSEEYVSGGRNAIAQKGKRHKKKKRKVGEDSEVKIPRLIVEFSVENRAKAKKQAEYKAQQRANTIKQKIEHKEKSVDAESKREKKKSRGARQRERKRKQKEEGLGEESNVDKASPAKKAKVAQDHSDSEPSASKQTPKATKPSKKRKVDKAEENLSKLVDSYEKSLDPATPASDAKKKDRSRPEKRWYED